MRTYRLSSSLEVLNDAFEPVLLRERQGCVAGLAVQRSRRRAGLGGESEQKGKV